MPHASTSGSTPDSKVCYRINDNGTLINVSVAQSSQCCVVYYENGVEVTDPARITALETLIQDADCTEIVDCAPDSVVCYEITLPVSATYAVAHRLSRANLAPSVPYYIKEIQIQTHPAGATLATVSIPSPGIMWWDGTAVVPGKEIAEAIKQTTLLAAWQSVGINYNEILGDPVEPAFAVVNSANTVTAAAASAYRMLFLEGPIGGVAGGAGVYAAAPFTYTDLITNPYKVVKVNGVTTYYKDGVELTSATDIAAAQAALATATADDVVCCPECVPEVPDNIACYEFGTDTYTVYLVNQAKTIYKNGVELTSATDISTAEDVLSTATDANIVDCSLVDSKVCYRLGTDGYTVVTVNNVKTYFKNGVELTTAAQITAAEALIAAATADDVVDCTPSDLCYEFPGPTVTQTYAVAECLEFGNGAAGVPLYLTQIRLRNRSTGVTMGTLNFSPALMVWNGTTKISPADFIAALNTVGYLPLVQSIDPRIDRFDVVSNGTVRIYAFDNQNTITSGNRIFAHTSDYSTSATGTPLSNTINNGAYTNITSTYSPTTDSYRQLCVNGVCETYKNGVLLTASADIAAAQLLIDAAGPEDVVSCTELQDSVVCYSIQETVTKTYAAAESFEIGAGTAGVQSWIGAINLKDVNTTGLISSLVLSPYIQVWDGTALATPAALKAALTSAGYLEFWQSVDPRIDRFDVVLSGGKLYIYVFDEENQYTTTNRIANHGVQYATSNGGAMGFENFTGAYANVTNTFVTESQYKAVTVNNFTTYYKEGVELTSSSDIALAKAAIDTASASDVVCCPECAPEIPVEDKMVCYSGPETICYTNKFHTYINRGTDLTPGQPEYIAQINIRYNSNVDCNVIVLSPNNIQVHDGTTIRDPALIKADLDAVGLLAKIQACAPLIDRYDVFAENNTFVLRAYSTDNSYNTQTFYFRVAYRNTPTGSPSGASLYGSTTSNWCIEEQLDVTVKTANGVTDYYVDGAKVTDYNRVQAIKDTIAGYDTSNVVCCPECVTEPLDVLTTVQPTPTATGNTTNLNSTFKDADGNTWIVDSNGDAILAGSVAETPDGQVCYSVAGAPITQTYAVAECLEFFNGNAGVPYYLTQIRLRSVSSGATLGTVNFSPPLMVWNGTTKISPANFITALNSAGYLAAVQAVDPRIDRFDVVTNGSVRIYAFDNQNLITTGNRVFAHTSDYSLSATGTPISNTITNGNYTNITSTYVSGYDTIRTVTANGTTQYYKNDVLLTAAADITAAQTAIAAATPADIVDCVAESVTCQAVMETETFTATAGQTSFSLINAPSGDVRFSRNGAALADNAATVTGSTVTYVPSANNATTLLAGDRIEISYVYNVCTGGATPTVVDGSETKVTAGTGITVTGAGTTGNPYVISTPTLPNYAQTVYLNNTTPATSTIFDLANPPTTHNAALMADPNNLYIGSNDSLWTYDSTTATYSPVGATLDNIHMRATIPSLALTANTARAANTLTTVHSTYPTAWNATTGVFTAPVAGYYQVNAQVMASASWAAGSFLALDLMKNGVQNVRWFDQAPVANSSLMIATGATTVYLAAGNTLSLQILSTIGTTTLANALTGYFTVDKYN